MLTTYASYALISRDIDRSLGRVEKQPMVQREVDYYLKNIDKVKSVEAFLKDDRLFKFAMKAHGLKDMDYAKAFIKKALTEGIDSPDTFANKLSDKRYREFVDTFNFARYGENATTLSKARQGTADKFIRQTMEEDAGAQNEGVRLALYFERKADKLNNFYEVLADPALSRVVRTALSLPESLATTDIDKQVALMEKGLDLEDLKDPEKLEKFLTRFTSLWEISNPSAGSSAPSIAMLFGQSGGVGVSMDTLFAIQSLRR